MNYYSVLPIHILRNKNLSPIAKILYMEITSRVGINGRMNFNLHGLAMSQGVKHYVIKTSLNDLAGEKLIFRIGQEISLHPPDSEESQQIELDLRFPGELIREWNDVFKKDLPEGVKQTATLTGIINACLQDYPKDDLMGVIPKWHSMCLQDDWWGDEKRKMIRANMYKFFTNEERMAQAMNFTGKKVVVQKDRESENNSLLN